MYRVSVAVCGVLVLLIGLGGMAATITVDDDGGMDHTTISAAISAAGSGDEIVVYPGTYTELVNVAKSDLTIRGTNRNSVVIDVTGLGGGNNNAGIYIPDGVSGVTLKKFTLRGSSSGSDPRYGLKVGEADDVLLKKITVENIYRTGFDLLGSSNVSLFKVLSQNNGGHGMQLCDCNSVDLTDVTVSGNGWSGVSICTWGRYTPLGTSGIVFSGTNSIDAFQLEEGDYNNPGSAPSGDAVITYSSNPAEGADVTVPPDDFEYAVHSDQDDGPDQNRVYLAEDYAEATALAASPAAGHMLATGRYIQSLADLSELFVSSGCEIQAAADGACADDTIHVEAGSFAGAVIGKPIHIDGADAGGTIISSGVAYSPTAAWYTTAFRLDAGADGAVIDDVTVVCAPGSSYYFAVFSRNVDDVVLENVVVYDTVQGISNWGGDNWEILNNQIIGTVAAGGGGIGFYIGVRPGTNLTSSSNLVQGNYVGSDATAPDYSCPGIVVALDLRYGGYLSLTGSEEITGNRIIGNTIEDGGVVNGVGIEMGIIMTGIADSLIPNLIQETLGMVHGNEITKNTVSGEYLGIYLYNVTDTTVDLNVISNCTGVGIGLWDGNDNNVFRYNSIAGNAYGLYNETGTVVDAALNWWGDAEGPSGEGSGAGDAVSTDVIFSPWLGTDPDGDSGTAGVQVTGPMLIIVDDVGAPPSDGYLNQAIVGSNELPFDDTIEVRHGTYDASQTITDGVEIVSEIGSAEHTTLTGPIEIEAPDVLLGKFRQGFSIDGPITVSSGVDATMIHINWNDIYGIVTNEGDGLLDATFNFWGNDGPDTVGQVDVYPLLPETTDTIIGYMDDHHLSATEAIEYSKLSRSMGRSTFAALGLMRVLGFTAQEAMEIIREYGRLRVSGAVSRCHGDFDRFLCDLAGYGSDGGLGGGGGGAVGPSGLPLLAIGDMIPLEFQAVHPATGEPVSDALVNFTISRTLEDGSPQIVAFGVMTYDADLGLYTFEFDSSGLEPGIYDVYMGVAGIGESQHMQIELVVP